MKHTANLDLLFDQPDGRVSWTYVSDLVQNREAFVEVLHRALHNIIVAEKRIVSPCVAVLSLYDPLRLTWDVEDSHMLFLNCSPEDPLAGNSVDTVGGLAERTFRALVDVGLTLNKVIEAELKSGQRKAHGIHRTIAFRFDYDSGKHVRIVFDETTGEPRRSALGINKRLETVAEFDLEAYLTVTGDFVRSFLPQSTNRYGMAFPITRGDEPLGVFFLYTDETFGAHVLKPLIEDLSVLFNIRFYQFFIESRARLRAYALRAAAAAIMARNKSHNIGSHVSPRSKLGDLRKRVEALILPVAKKEGMSKEAFSRMSDEWLDGRYERESDEAWDAFLRMDAPTEWNSDTWENYAFRILCNLRDELDDYGQRRDEFVAEFSTDPLISTRAASLYSEVILPFVQNTALIDGIAANESFTYAWEDRPGIVVRCFVRQTPNGIAQEIEPTFHPEKITAAEWAECVKDLHVPPYGMRYASEPGRDTVVDVSPETFDPKIALPGPVGEMAFYGILENLIRNAAKHGHRSRGDVDSLEVHVVTEPQGEDYYRVYMYENLTGPGRMLKDLRAHMQKHIESEIVNSAGECRQAAWGTAEMKLCADLLCGVAPGEELGEDYALRARVLEADEIPMPFREGRNRWRTPQGVLAYEFSVRKACAAVFLGFPEDAELVDLLKPHGFRFLRGEGLVSDHYMDLPPAFQFAVLHGSLFESPEFSTDELGWLRRLPFRVIACGVGNDTLKEKLKIYAGVCCIDNISRLEDLANCSAEAWARDHKNTNHGFAESITHWLWQTWLQFLRQRKRSGKTVIEDLYFHQEQSVSPTASWIKRAKEFNAKCPAATGIGLRVWAKRSGSSVVYPVVESPVSIEDEHILIRVDRHGGLTSDRASEKMSKRDCLVVIDKASRDFETFYNSGIDSPWTLPYELAEAGLLRILILDERIAQRAHAPYEGTEEANESFREALTGSAKRAPTLGDLADSGGVRISPRIDFRDEAGETHHLYLAQKAWEKGKNTNTGEDYSNPAVIKVVLARDASNHRRLEVRKLRVHRSNCLVVVHQGIIDLIRDRFSPSVSKGFVQVLSRSAWTVIESGRGIPPEVQGSRDRFLSFSLIERAFHGNRVAKVSLTRHLMEVTRNCK